MKCLRPLVIALICFCTAHAQDGFFTLAKAPLVISRDGQTTDFTFTNNGDKFLRRIRITSMLGIKRESLVIIETLGPHKSVTYDVSKSIVPGADLHEATITCSGYSVPIKLDQ